MRTITISTLLVLVFGASATPAAERLSKLDIAGVRIGMTKDQAAQTLAKHFEVPRARIDDVENFEYHGLVFDDGKTKVQVELANDPATNKPAVTTVQYAVPATQENLESMKAAALQKYGEPSSAPGTNGYDVKWCADRASAGSTSKPESAQNCNGEEKISLSINSRKILLFLIDSNRRSEAKALEEDAVRRSQSTKPKL